MKKFLLSFVITLISLGAFSQWQPTNGPIGGYTGQVYAFGSKVFLGGDATSNLYTSVDNGDTWTFNPACAAFNGTVAAMNSINTKLFVLAGTDLYLSTDTGTSFSSIYSFGGYGSKLVKRGADLFAVANGQFLKSATQGVSWTTQTMPPAGVSQLGSAGTNLFSLSSSDIYISLNDGSAWSSCQNNLPAGTYSGMGIIGTDIYVLINSTGLYKSTNFGSSWTQVTFGSPAITGMSTLYSSNGALFMGDGYTGNYLSTDGGSTWTAYGGIMGAINSFIETNGDFIASGSVPGTPWKNYGGFGASSANYNIVETRVQEMLAFQNSIFASATSGNFETPDAGNNYSYSSVIPYYVKNKAYGQNSIYVISSNNDMTGVSFDGGLTWTHKPFTLSGNIKAIAGKGDTLYVATSNGLYTSLDTGNTWTLNAFAFGGDQDLYSVVISNGKIFANNTTNIYFSSDWGATWTLKNTGIPPSFSKVELFAASNYLFVTVYGGGGIYKYNFSTNAWAASSSGFNPIGNTVSQIWSATNGLCIGSSNGFYFSTSGGQSWTALNSGLTNTYIMDVVSDASNIYAGMYAGGVWKIAYTDSVFQTNISLSNDAVSDSICLNQAINFSASGGVSYQFFVNGVSQGAASANSSFSTSTLTAGTHTISVIGTGQLGGTDTAYNYITVMPVAVPNVSISVASDTILCAGSPVTFYATGATLYEFFINYQGQGQTAADSITTVQGGSFSAYVIGTANGICQNTSDTINITFISAATPATPSICMITVDSMSLNNMIMWDESAMASSDTVCIYRDIANNNYQLIGKVPYDSVSLFTDTVRTLYAANGDPNVSSWRYKIAVKNVCGIMSAMSPYHQTMFFQNSSGNFSWNHYEIEGQATPVAALSNYLFKRDDNATGVWGTIQTLSASSTAYTDLNYATFQATADWRVETQWTVNCNPTMKLVQGTMAAVTKSRSNIQNNRVNVGMKDIFASDFTVYPNPAGGQITVHFNSLTLNAQVEIFDLAGKLVKNTSSANASELKIYLGELSEGSYFVRISANGVNAIKKLVIVK
jgi:hypothetical protein